MFCPSWTQFFNRSRTEDDMAKGKLRHLAISVPDKEKAARFYEETFGFERVAHSRVATRLPDGGSDEHHAATVRNRGRCRGRARQRLRRAASFRHSGGRHRLDETFHRSPW